MFIGFVDLDQTLYAPILLRDASRAPVDADASVPVSVRVYGPDGPVAGMAGVAARMDVGTVAGASNTTPVVVTSVGHGLTTGVLVIVSGVLGNTAANGTFRVTLVDADHYSLDGSVGTGDYAGAGSWHVAGLYTYAIVASAANGFEVGVAYTALVSYRVGGVAGADAQVFIVT